MLTLFKTLCRKNSPFSFSEGLRAMKTAIVICNLFAIKRHPFYYSFPELSHTKLLMR